MQFGKLLKIMDDEHLQFLEMLEGDTEDNKTLARKVYSDNYLKILQKMKSDLQLGEEQNLEVKISNPLDSFDKKRIANG